MAQWATEGTYLSGGCCVEEDMLYASYQMVGYYTASSIGSSGEDEGQTGGGSIIGSAIVRGANGT